MAVNEDAKINQNPLVSTIEIPDSVKRKRLKNQLNIIEETQDEEEDKSEDTQKFFDNHTYVGEHNFFSFIDIKSSEEISILDVEPENELMISVQPPKFKASNFLNIKNDLDIDDEEYKNEDQKEIDMALELKKTCGFRFLKKNTFMFQVTSSNSSNHNSQINICCDVTSIQGFFKFHFYTKYWFMNSTELPLSLKFTEVSIPNSYSHSMITSTTRSNYPTHQGN
jgi:hypothetical protein